MFDPALLISGRHHDGLVSGFWLSLRLRGDVEFASAVVAPLSCSAACFGEEILTRMVQVQVHVWSA